MQDAGHLLDTERLTSCESSWDPAVIRRFLLLLYLSLELTYSAPTPYSSHRS